LYKKSRGFLSFALSRFLAVSLHGGLKTP
jgi:hypothetical protein